MTKGQCHHQAGQAVQSCLQCFSFFAGVSRRFLISWLFQQPPREESGARDNEARQPSVGDDIESLLDDGSVVSGAEEYIAPSEPEPAVAVAESLTPPIRAALAWLDEADLEAEFQRRAAVMKTVPHFLRGPYRWGLAMGEAHQESEHRRERGWKLFLMLPRLLLFRPCRGGNVHKEKLSKRFQDFSDGRWTQLFTASRQCAEDASQAQRRKRRRRRPEEELERRAARAFSSVQLGELSSGRQALEGASVASGTQQTLEALRDPDRRPPLPRDPLPEAILEHEPEVSFSLEARRFAANLRSSRRGAAAGLSGMTTDHLRLVLDQVRDTHMLCQMADQFTQARTPPAVHNILRLGRLTALQKPRGGVRGIVVGDVLRRLVARTMAQQLGKAVEAATAPYQYALSTRARTECVAHALQVLTEMDPMTTIVSIDGVGAYDSISRKAMLEALVSIPGGSAVLPFARLFYGQPVFMGRRGRSHSPHPPGRGWGTGGPTHALALFIGLIRCT